MKAPGSARAWTAVVVLGSCVACVLHGCSDRGEGLLIFEITLAEDVPTLDTIEIGVDDQAERFAGSTDPKPGLFLPEGTYEVSVAGLVGQQVVARADKTERVRVTSDHTQLLKTHLQRVALQPGEPAGGADGGVLDGVADPSKEGATDDGDHDVTALANSMLDAGTSGPQGSAMTDAGPQGPGRDAAAAGDSTSTTTGNPPPRNPACGGDGVSVPLEVAFSDNFDNYSAGAIADDASSPWVIAEDGRTGVFTTTWAYAGQAMMVQSFTTSTEWVYVRLPVATQPAKLSVELIYTPDGFTIYDDFAELGFAQVGASKFDVTPLLAARAQEHLLLFKTTPTDPRAGVEQQGTSVYDEIEFARQPLDEPPIHQYVRVDLDLCLDEASFYVGADATAPLSKRVSFAPVAGINAFYVAGGLSATYFDEVVIRIGGDDL